MAMRPFLIIALMLGLVCPNGMADVLCWPVDGDRPDTRVHHCPQPLNGPCVGAAELVRECVGLKPSSTEQTCKSVRSAFGRHVTDSLLSPCGITPRQTLQSKFIRWQV